MSVIACATASCPTPRLWSMPTLPSSFLPLLGLILRMVAVLRLSAVIVTHDLAVARMLSHRIIVIKDGVAIESGLTDQVLDAPREPYTQLLVSSILPA